LRRARNFREQVPNVLHHARKEGDKKKDDAKFSARMPKQIPNLYIYIYMFNETRTYPSSSVPSFKQQYIDVCIMKFAWKAVVLKNPNFFLRRRRKISFDEKRVSFKNNWLIEKGNSSSSSCCVCYILSSLLRQLSLPHQDGERLFSANDVLLLLLLLLMLLLFVR